MKIEIFKTHEVPESLWVKISEGFNECFEGLQTTEETIKRGFCVSTQTGYSYHGIAFSDENDIMGYTVFTPTFYENDIKIVAGGGTFIKKKYRDDFLLFAKIVNALKKRCFEDGFQAIIAVPNANSKDYAIRINRFVYVDDLDFYLLPLHPSKVLHKPIFKLFDGISSIIMACWVKINLLFSKLINHPATRKKIELVVDDEFYFSRFKEKYYTVNSCGKYRYCYRHYDEDGVDTIYLMDFRENGQRTSRALNFCLNDIIKKDCADAILFVGFLDMKQGSLFKVPKRFIPKPLPFTYHVIDKKNRELDEIMKYRNAWDFSLMNFDVR